MAWRLQAGGKSALERGREGRWEQIKSVAAGPTPSAAELRIAELEQLLGRKQVELDFFKRPSSRSGEQRRIVPAMATRGLFAASKPRSQSKE